MQKHKDDIAAVPPYLSAKAPLSYSFVSRRWYHKAANASLAAETKLSVDCLCLVTCPPRSGAEGGTRTRTESSPRDFKSLASAIPPLRQLLEAPPRLGLGNKGFADLCLTTWLWCHNALYNMITRALRFILLSIDSERR